MMSYENITQVKPKGKEIENNQMLTLYDNVWYLLEKLGLHECIRKSNSDKKKTEEKHNWTSSNERCKL